MDLETMSSAHYLLLSIGEFSQPSIRVYDLCFNWIQFVRIESSLMKIESNLRFASL